MATTKKPADKKSAPAETEISKDKVQIAKNIQKALAKRRSGK